MLFHMFKLPTYTLGRGTANKPSCDRSFKAQVFAHAQVHVPTKEIAAGVQMPVISIGGVGIV